MSNGWALPTAQPQSHEWLEWASGFTHAPGHHNTSVTTLPRYSDSMALDPDVKPSSRSYTQLLPGTIVLFLWASPSRCQPPTWAEPPWAGSHICSDAWSTSQPSAGMGLWKTREALKTPLYLTGHPTTSPGPPRAHPSPLLTISLSHIGQPWPLFKCHSNYPQLSELY